MSKDLLSTKDIALELKYTKQHILNVAKAHKINPSQIIRSNHGNPNFLWTPAKKDKIAIFLGGKKGRPVGSKNKKTLDKTE